LATQLGLPGVAAQRARELAAFALLLRVPVVSLLRRESDGESALAPSPLLERLLLSLRREQREAAVLPERHMPRRLALQPVVRPLPRLGRQPELLPRQLSATACEALRACPYRFHALVGLGLREADELDDAIEKRDVGTWLHAVLQRFHVERGAMNDAPADEAQLQAVADSVREEMGLLQADFLPHALWFQQLIPGYVAWLHKDEAAGAHFREGEVELKAQPEELAGVGVSLRGRIDRLDGVYESGGHALRIVDYKASRPNDWRKRVKQPLEDTQLAFYAALLQTARAEPPAGLHAAYLALEGDKPSLVEHAQVGASAQQLLLGLADELGRIAAGEPLPALGEEPACTYCEARGLCRRDHWGDTP
ncbi:MAG TPA: PD-(D/E)XK nuclease family protein, partial [Methylibium sp.]